VVVIAALAGGAAGAGLLAATGALDSVPSSTTTTVVQQVSGGGTTTSGLNAGSVYASTAAGIVDIAARGTTTVQSGPFGEPQSRQTTASGSGFVIDRPGHIVTAAHVVDNATSITVKLQDGTTRPAAVLGTDNATDIAVLKIDPTGLTLHPLKLGSSASLGIGDAVAAIGDPFSYERSISTGIISGVDRTIEAPNGFTVAHALQTDAALNPGNSGGPLLDSQGRVIGVVDQIASNGADQSSGVGFAVSIDLVSKELSSLMNGQSVRHAYLGLSTSNATGTTGALVGQVTSGSPADDAGAKASDVVTALGATAVNDSNDLVAAIAGHHPGDTVTLTVRRGASTLHLTAKLGTQPTQSVGLTG
jgi:putative serine protease PepD